MDDLAAAPTQTRFFKQPRKVKLSVLRKLNESLAQSPVKLNTCITNSLHLSRMDQVMTSSFQSHEASRADIRTTTLIGPEKWIPREQRSDQHSQMLFSTQSATAASARRIPVANGKTKAPGGQFAAVLASLNLDLKSASLEQTLTMSQSTSRKLGGTQGGFSS